MPNPDFLFCDSDVLIQLFLVKQTRLLDRLSSEYHIRPIVVSEVEGEIRNHRKFGQEFEQPFLDATRSEILGILDEDTFGNCLADCGFPLRLSENLWEKIQDLGNRLSSCIQGGEAYTHAAGQVLSMPILSNDYAAINTLRNSGCPTAVPALRSFDLFCFAYKQKWLDTGSFKSLLQALASKNEWIHQDFLGMPWPQLEEKIETFQCRLIAWEKHGSSPPSPNRYMDPLYLTFSG